MALSEAAKEAKKNYNKEWRRNNRERYNTYQNEWRKNNPERIAQYQAQFWEKVAASNENQTGE